MQDFVDQAAVPFLNLMMAVVGCIFGSKDVVKQSFTCSIIYIGLRVHSGVSKCTEVTLHRCLVERNSILPQPRIPVSLQGETERQAS